MNIVLLQNDGSLQWGASSKPVLFCTSAYNVKIKEVDSRVSAHWSPCMHHKTYGTYILHLCQDNIMD
jgi:hypothetical protein